jgi:hypothetical protein
MAIMADEQLNEERLELEIIKRLFASADIRSKVFDRLDPDYFQFGEQDDSHGSYFKALRDMYLQYRRFPALDTFGSFVKRERTALKGTHRKIVELVIGESDAPDFMERLRDWIRNRSIISLQGDMFQKLNQRDFEGLPAVFAQMAMASSFAIDEKIGMAPLTDEGLDAVAEHCSPDRSDYVPCGIDIMDSLMGGGWGNSTLGGVVMPVNEGKTMFLCNSCANAVRKGYKALYMSMEEKQVSISTRIVKNLIERNRLEMMELSVNRRRLREMVDSAVGANREHLWVMELPESGTTPNDLLRQIKLLDSRYGFVPDIIFVDYVGKMNPNGKRSGAQRWQELAEVTVQVRDISRMELGNHPPIVTAWQYNKEGSKGRTGKLTELGGSYDQAATADIIWADVEPDVDEEEDGILKLKLAKAREASDGAKGQSVLLIRKYEHQKVLGRDDSKNREFSKSSKAESKGYAGDAFEYKGGGYGS